MRSARWSIALGGLLFSTGGAAIKACSFATWQVAGLRSALAALVVLALVPGSRRAWSRSTMLVALAYAATLTLFIAANKQTTAANAIFLQSTAPLWVFVLGPLLLGERPTRRDAGAALAIGAGIAILFAGTDAPRATAPDPALGDLFAIASGASWALTLIGIRWQARRDPAAAATAVVAGNVCTFAIALPFAWPLPAGTPTDWAWLAWLGIAQVGVAYVLVTRGMRQVSSVDVALILMIEPALNPLFTWLVHGEAPSARSIAGGSVIVGALLAHSLRRR